MVAEVVSDSDTVGDNVSDLKWPYEEMFGNLKATLK
jgi:Zn-dependent oligopeptidase